MINKSPVYLIKNGAAENKESRSCIDDWKYVAELGKQLAVLIGCQSQNPREDDTKSSFLLYSLNTEGQNLLPCIKFRLQKEALLLLSTVIDLIVHGL